MEKKIRGLRGGTVKGEFFGGESKQARRQRERERREKTQK
jgi:hypothetical protein